MYTTHHQVFQLFAVISRNYRVAGSVRVISCPARSRVDLAPSPPETGSWSSLSVRITGSPCSKSIAHVVAGEGVRGAGGGSGTRGGDSEVRRGCGPSLRASRRSCDPAITSHAGSSASLGLPSLPRRLRGLSRLTRSSRAARTCARGLAVVATSHAPSEGRSGEGKTVREAAGSCCSGAEFAGYSTAS